MCTIISTKLLNYYDDGTERSVSQEISTLQANGIHLQNKVVIEFPSDGYTIDFHLSQEKRNRENELTHWIYKAMPNKYGIVELLIWND